MISTSSTSFVLPDTRYCPGCDQYLSVDLFGVNNSAKDRISYRCRECNNKATKAYYAKNLEMINAKKHNQWVELNPPKKKPTFIKLKMHRPIGLLLRKCPSCKALLSVCPEMKIGKCTYCLEEFKVIHRLGGVSLEAEFKKRDYENEILNYIKRKQRVCPSEIIAGTNISKGTTCNVLKKLKEENVLNVIPWGKIRYVELNQ